MLTYLFHWLDTVAISCQINLKFYENIYLFRKKNIYFQCNTTFLSLFVARKTNLHKTSVLTGNKLKKIVGKLLDLFKKYTGSFSN